MKKDYESKINKITHIKNGQKSKLYTYLWRGENSIKMNENLKYIIKINKIKSLTKIQKDKYFKLLHNCKNTSDEKTKKRLQVTKNVTTKSKIISKTYKIKNTSQINKILKYKWFGHIKDKNILDFVKKNNIEIFN